MQGNTDGFELGTDGISIAAVSGWALDPDTPEVPVRVKAFVNGVPWGSAVADSFRPDLKAVHPTGGCAFRIPLRLPLAAGRGLVAGDTLQVLAQSTGTGRTAVVPLDPKMFLGQLRLRLDETPKLPARSDGTAVGVFTMVYNEPVNLPLWLRHYAGQFGSAHCYVLDHGSDDGSTTALAGNHVRLPRDPMDSLTRAGRCSAFQHFLLRFYDTVIYTDSDELIVADPRHYTGLAHWCQERRLRQLRPLGFDLVHDSTREPDFDPAQPVLAQRGYWCSSKYMCKPVVGSDPLNWKPGFHELVDGSPTVPLDPDLQLIHLRLMDESASLRKQAQYRALRWSPRQLERGWAAYQREDDDALRRTFAGLIGTRVPDDAGLETLFGQEPADSGPVTRVPERFRSSF